MESPAERVRFDEDGMRAHPADGRILGVPLAWFPRLLAASPEARAEVTISAYGLRCATLDEAISAPALLAGRTGADEAA